MSSRALRRLQKQRELEQQEAEQESASDTDAQELKPSKPAFNAFDLLEVHDANEEESDVAEVPVENTLHGDEPAPSPKASSSKRKKQKKKKGNKGAVSAHSKPSGSATPNDADLDDIDLALRELSTKQKDETETDLVAGQARVANDEREATLCALLAIDSKRLNAMNEMKKLFGSAAIESRYSDSGEQSPGRRRDRNRQALDLGRALTGRFNPTSRGQDLSGMTLRKNILMQSKDEWPRATSGGLGMEVVKKELSGVTEYKIVHNAAYEDVQRQFDICVQSMQSERMIEHLQFNPYHISTLLQVSEIAKHQGDHAVSGDLLERALFNIGRSVQSSFGSCLREGKARLDFDVKENREFWLAGWRYLINLGMKGTWKTAYEWAKVLLSLDPDDPYCISLTIDQIAIKAQEHEHFIQLCTHPTFSDRWKLLPNIHSSLALAYFQRGSAKESREHLRTAISRYPWIFCRLTQELNISPVPKSIWGAQAPNEAFELFTELYISRAKDIWNTPEVISLLMEVADSIDAPKPTAEAPLITLNVARHVILSDIPAVTTHLPRSFIANRISASDPLPPNEDHETEAQRPGDASWFYGAVRDMIGLENVEELLGGFVPPFGRDRNQDPETDLDAWSDDENGGASEELESYLFTTGLQEVCEFISVNGVDPGNWQIERDETPIAAWIRRLKELHPAVWTEMIEIASSRAGLPMLSPVLRDELSRTTDTASE